ncbi:hypothetical protein IHZ02_001290 [Salmonella enterica]|nr:hypothetical protein [Salmonella enterica]EJN5974451.1 hypothetical protein [Salmonella enterica]
MKNTITFAPLVLACLLLSACSYSHDQTEQSSTGSDSYISLDVTNEAAQIVWQLVMAKGGEIVWDMDDGSCMVLKAEKREAAKGRLPNEQTNR